MPTQLNIHLCLCLFFSLLLFNTSYAQRKEKKQSAFKIKLFDNAAIKQRDKHGATPKIVGENNDILLFEVYPFASRNTYTKNGANILLVSGEKLARKKTLKINKGFLQRKESVATGFQLDQKKFFLITAQGEKSTTKIYAYEISINNLEVVGERQLLCTYPAKTDVKIFTRFNKKEYVLWDEMTIHISPDNSKWLLETLIPKEDDANAYDKMLHCFDANHQLLWQKKVETLFPWNNRNDETSQLSNDGNYYFYFNYGPGKKTYKKMLEKETSPKFNYLRAVINNGAEVKEIELPLDFQKVVGRSLKFAKDAISNEVYFAGDFTNLSVSKFEGDFLSFNGSSGLFLGRLEMDEITAFKSFYFPKELHQHLIIDKRKIDYIERTPVEELVLSSQYLQKVYLRDDGNIGVIMDMRRTSGTLDHSRGTLNYLKLFSLSLTKDNPIVFWHKEERLYVRQDILLVRNIAYRGDVFHRHLEGKDYLCYNRKKATSRGNNICALVFNEAGQIEKFTNLTEGAKPSDNYEMISSNCLYLPTKNEFLLKVLYKGRAVKMGTVSLTSISEMKNKNNKEYKYE